MFYECESLISLPDISKWNTSNVNKMEGIFRRCKSLISLPNLSKLDLRDNNILDICFNLLNISK